MKQYKFRCSIYVDFFIQDIADQGLEACREKAQEKADKMSLDIPNSYIGGLGTMDEIMNGKVM